MNRIKVSLISIILLCNLTIVSGQNIILKLNSNVKPIYCTDICIQNAKVTFIDVSTGKNHEYSLNEIGQIKFFENKPNEIYISRLQLDTIKCNVDSITGSSIYFRLEDNQPKVVDNSSVFCVQFNGLRNETTDLYRDKFFELNAVQYANKPKIVRRDGTLIDIKSLTSLGSEKIEFYLMKNGIERTTNIDTKEISSYVNKEIVGKRNIIPSSGFIMPYDGKLFEVLITQVNEKTVEYIVNSSFSTKTQTLQKEAIAGIFFFDYSSKKVIPSSNVVYSSNYGNKNFKKIRFDFNAGTGYMLANAPTNFSEEEIKFLDDLRLGFTIDMNLNYFLIKEFGFGLKFNQFKTSNSISNPFHYENNIRVRFFGISLLSQLELINNRFFLNSGISFGRLLEVNKVKKNWDTYKIDGKTNGTYIFMGFDYFIEDYISIGIKGALMTGKIDQLKMNDENIEMQGEESLLRTDVLLNFMIYF